MQKPPGLSQSGANDFVKVSGFKATKGQAKHNKHGLS